MIVGASRTGSRQPPVPRSRERRVRCTRRLRPDEEGTTVSEAPSPEGGVYEWFHRGLQLLRDGHPAAAATLLARAAEQEPQSRSILEALARAQYDAGRYPEAMDAFTALIGVNPTDDYAQFGLGLAA